MEKVGRVRFSIIREVGLDSHGNRRGRNSRVFLADELALGGQVAVKVMKKKAFTHPDEYFREAQVMFASHSPHVTPVQYMWERKRIVALVMKYFSRGSLADKIEHGPLPPSQVVKIGQGILSGLARIHNARTIHFDIKPSNVLFSDSSTPMLSDFGQARTLRSDGTVEWPGVYDLALPPEWYSSSARTAYSDIYQVGLTLYRAVNGDPFFKDQVPLTDADLETKILAGKFPDRNKWMPHVPKKLRKVIRKAMSVVPTDRYDSPSDVQNALTFNGKDWQTTIDHGSGDIEWVAKPPGKAKIIVKSAKNGDRWTISIFKEKKTRSRFRPSEWKTGLTQAQANAHLTALFRSLA